MEPHRDLLLAICGVLQGYLAAVDPSIFNLITRGDLSDRSTVALATISAAAVPFFFGLGALKEAIIPSTETVFFYERMLKGATFWVLSSFFMISLLVILYLNGAFSILENRAVGGLLLFASGYLLLTAKRRARRPR